MKPITIIGGGIAGLATGIALRQRAIPVTLLEAQSYPRHKVCGEFLHGSGLKSLEELELNPASLGIPIETISFHHRGRSSAATDLPSAGVAIARFAFDCALADKFVKLGGNLRCHTRAPMTQADDGCVRATGRKLRRATKWKWYGLKAHASNVPLEADLELHLANNGYIGLCRLSGNRVNVCGLFRRRTDARERNLVPVEHFVTAPSLHERLRHAQWQEDSFVAVSGLPIGETVEISDSFSVGDAFSMIPPFTGNGMSIAIESAVLAAKPLEGYARGELSWQEATQAFHGASATTFSRRIAAANLSQKLLNSALCQQLFVRTADHISLWQRVFEMTR